MKVSAVSEPATHEGLFAVGKTYWGTDRDARHAADSATLAGVRAYVASIRGYMAAGYTYTAEEIIDALSAAVKR